MACLLVPAAEAVITTIATKVVKSKEKAAESVQPSAAQKIPFSKKLGWLNKLLWGGTALLAFEHIWHGEITPWFPFLTATNNPADTAQMLHELSTTGVAMAVLVTAVWAGMLVVSAAMEKKAKKALPTEG